MSSPIFLIPIVSILAMGLTTIVVKTSNTPPSKTGVTRNFLTLNLKESGHLIHDGKVSNIIGASGDYFYLQAKEATEIWKVYKEVKQNTVFHLENDFTKGNDSHFFPFMDSLLNVYHFYFNEKKVFIKNLNSSISNSYPLNAISFSKVYPIQPNSFIFRGNDTSRGKSVCFIKLSPETGKMKICKDILSDNDQYGMFSDGLFSYQPESGTLAYTCFFSNKFVILDTNLNIKLYGKTIDTFSTPQIKLTTIKSGNQEIITNGTPSKMVNWYSCIYNGYLFINSKVKADNESPEMDHNNAVIDIYNLNNGSYVGSFYIPHYKEKKLIKYRVYKDHILVIYPNDIVSYEFNLFNHS